MSVYTVNSYDSGSKFGVLVMINRLQIFLCQHSLTCNAILPFQCQNLLLYAFFFHLHKLNSQLRVDLKESICYVRIHFVDPQQEIDLYMLTLLVCLVNRHCSQRCHI